MAERAGPRAQRTVHVEHPGTNRTVWVAVAPVVLVLVLLSVAAIVFLDSHLLLFASGAAVTGVSWWLSARTTLAPAPSGPSNTLLSLDGETMTADALDALAPLGWRSLHHLPLGHGHIDHVAVGPGGVFAVETNLSTTLWTLNVPDARLLEAAAQTKRSAAKARSILRAQGVVVDVQPLLVLWGDAVGETDAVDGVTVVLGAELGRWFEERSVGGSVDVGRVEAALTEFVARQGTAA